MQQTTMNRNSMICSRRWLVALGLTALLGTSAALADEATDPKVVRLTAPDQQPIVITYYPAIEAKAGGKIEEAPVILLLPGEDKLGRIQWDKHSSPRNGGKNFPERLQDEGYAVITADLRKYGDSKAADTNAKIRPIDYDLMGEADLPTIKQFIYEEHQLKHLNMNKMGIIAAGPICAVALGYSVLDWSQPPYDDAPVLENKTPRGQDVRALVLISPENGGAGGTFAKSVTFLRNPQFGIGMLVLVGTHDTKDKGQAKKVFELMSAGQLKDENRVFMQAADLKDRGLGLVGKAPNEVEDNILLFLDLEVKQNTSVWRDRRSKLTIK
jgi:hypothetical protein